MSLPPSGRASGISYETTPHRAALAFSREGYRVIAFDRRGWGKSFGTSGNMLRWCISSARADVVIKVALRP
jgi:pimeloyl-ACP methyl ester carboxylesterase